MDERRFDHLAKSVAGGTRRSLLKAVVGTAIGGALSVTGIESAGAAAAKRKLGQICRKDGDCASSYCSPPNSRGRSYCRCNDASDCPAPSAKCQEATCNPDGTCGTGPRNCDDNNRCTVDACDPQVGCIHVPVVCDDSNACTKDTCDPQIGCVFTQIICDDGNACTTSTCDKTKGCVNTPITCPEQCDPEIGCVECLVASDCADFDGHCKSATCDAGVCNTLLTAGLACYNVFNTGACDEFGTCCMAPTENGACVCPEFHVIDWDGVCCIGSMVEDGLCT